MRPVGIVVALTAESKTLTTKRLREGDLTTLPGGGLLALSGAGPDAASRAATQLIANGAKTLISWGCAAALAPGLRPGDLILPNQLLQADHTAISTDPEGTRQLADSLRSELTPHGGTLIESGEIVAHATIKRSLFDTTGAMALDMESGAIGRMAREHGLRFMIVRSIVDPAAVTLPPSIASAFDDQGRLRVPTLLRGALKCPNDWPALIQLGRHFGSAMATLRRVHALAGSACLGSC